MSVLGGLGIRNVVQQGTNHLGSPDDCSNISIRADVLWDSLARVRNRLPNVTMAGSVSQDIDPNGRARTLAGTNYKCAERFIASEHGKITGRDRGGADR